MMFCFFTGFFGSSTWLYTLGKSKKVKNMFFQFLDPLSKS